MPACAKGRQGKTEGEVASLAKQTGLLRRKEVKREACFVLRVSLFETRNTKYEIRFALFPIALLPLRNIKRMQ